ncbi:Uncharacterized protein dnm_032150 [Desulfonema magnum]|uniref:Uncharacterized protein n=1 Tax=Desulfonema magnum TaxID=45655 RepID=A0A975BKN1_9BACT|nr:Uncharacterized protein dnm_032150 [Desulfonema magnum]
MNSFNFRVIRTDQTFNLTKGFGVFSFRSSESLFIAHRRGGIIHFTSECLKLYWKGKFNNAILQF